MGSAQRTNRRRESGFKLTTSAFGRFFHARKEHTMLIKFTATDPRAGTVAQMDSSRGEQLIAEGAAEAFSESAPAQASQEAPADKPAKKAK